MVLKCCMRLTSKLGWTLFSSSLGILPSRSFCDCCSELNLAHRLGGLSVSREPQLPVGGDQSSGGNASLLSGGLGSRVTYLLLGPNMPIGLQGLGLSGLLRAGG